jgi:hypothetical protein
MQTLAPDDLGSAYVDRGKIHGLSDILNSCGVAETLSYKLEGSGFDSQ